MTRQSCSHGSVSRLVVHLYWCRRCSEWRWYKYGGFWSVGRRGAIGRWAQNQLRGMGCLPLHETEPEELLQLVRGWFLEAQVIDAEALAGGQGDGHDRLVERLRRLREDPTATGTSS